MNPVHLLLVDGSNTMMRAFWGYPNIRVPFLKLRDEAKARGEELTDLPEELKAKFVDAIRGMLARLIREQQCTHLVWAQDSISPTFRHQEYPEYKGTRERKFPGTGYLARLLEPHLAEWGVLSLRVEGFEADDLLATLAKRAQARGHQATCVSADNDILQLVSEGIRVIRPHPEKDGYLEATDAWVQEQYGYRADQVVCWKILRGDEGDNIPAVGIPSKPNRLGKTQNLGVSERKALALLAQFGSLEKIYQVAALEPQPEDREQCIPSPERERLLASREKAEQLRRLVLLRDDVPIVGVDASLSSVRKLRLPAPNPALSRARRSPEPAPLVATPLPVVAPQPVAEPERVVEPQAAQLSLLR